jgi:hypothetical protein
MVKTYKLKYRYFIMNFQFYLEKLMNSEDFLKFKKENPNAYLCSGFFSIDKEKDGQHEQHLDYYVPEFDKIFSFKLLNEGKVEMVPVESYNDAEKKEKPRKLNDNYDFEFKDIEKMIEKKIEEEKINKKVLKMLFSMQNKEGKDFLIGTVFITGLGLLKCNVDLQEKKIVEFEKKSFFDMMRIVKK